MIMPPEYRAPFVAPGRRNRRVFWNRPLSRVIASLGKFEQEDWRRAQWFPKSLRQFYPKWMNKFTPGGSCVCCGGFDPCTDCEDCLTGGPYPDCEVDVPAFTDDDCADCELIEGTYILSPFGSQCSWFYQDSDSGVCGPLSVLSIFVTFSCGPEDKCRVDSGVLIGSDQREWFNQFPGDDPVNYFRFADLPWTMPYVGKDLLLNADHCIPSGDPMIIQGFS